jgi:urate oxidase
MEKENRTVPEKGDAIFFSLLNAKLAYEYMWNKFQAFATYVIFWSAMPATN